MTAPVPQHIHLHQRARELELVYGNDERYRLSCEFLRVYSPSAEVRGHGGRGGTLPTGQRLVNIAEIHPVGHYALQLVFSDGHDSGLYSWDYLYDLCRHRNAYWQAYLEQLEASGGSRDPVVIFKG